jgi:hypothetical protein
VIDLLLAATATVILWAEEWNPLDLDGSQVFLDPGDSVGHVLGGQLVAGIE